MRKFIKKVVFIGCCFAGIIKLQAQVPVLGIPKGHLAEVYLPDFSPDGRLIVTPSSDKTAKVWELLTGRLLFSLEGHTKQVIFAKFTNDNKNVITAGDNSIIIWDALTGKKKVHLFHGEIPGIDFNNLQGQVIYASSLTAIALSKDGKYMASGATDSTIIIWDIEKGKKSGN